MTPEDQMHYCIHMKVTLGEGRGIQPPPSHALNVLLIADILQEACPRDHITEAVVLAPGEAILFFGRCLCNGGLLYCDAQDIDHGLRCSVMWTGRTAQVEVTANTIQEGHRAIVNAVLETKMNARGPGHPQGLRGVAQSSSAACNVNNWM